MPGAVLGRRCAFLLRGACAAVLLCAGSAWGASTVVDTGRPQCCASLVPELPPATTYGATMLRRDDTLAAWKPHIATPPDPPAPARELELRVEEEEARGGPMAPGLVAPLNGLAAAYLAEGRDAEAAQALRRAMHVARLSEGLHTPLQVEMLEQLIAIHVRQGDFAAADKAQDYLYRVRSWQRQHGGEGMLEATLRYAHWIRGAYLGDLGRERFPRLVGLNDLFQGAIDELEASHGPDSRELLPYLQGRVELSYLISVYPGENESGFRAQVSQPSDFDMASEAQLRFWRLRDFNFRYGLQNLRRREDILHKDPRSTPQERVLAHVAVADWYQWHRRYASAIRHYEEAWTLMDGVEGGEAWLESQLAEPLELPREAIFNPGAIPLGTLHDAEVTMRFDVSRHGEAKDIEVLSEAARDSQAAVTRAYHYLRNMRFRPRLQQGSVVRAEDIERSYQIRY